MDIYNGCIVKSFQMNNNDEKIEYGDIVGIDSDGFITRTNLENKANIFPIGVCHFHTSEKKDINEHDSCPIIVSGVEHVKVLGLCNVGDYIIASKRDGIGLPLKRSTYFKDMSKYNVIGIALKKSNDYNISFVKILIK